MDTTHIATLLEPYLCPSGDASMGSASHRALAPSQLEQISIYIDLLLRWNARINLTAIRKEEEIVTRHFGESLFMARHLFPSPSELRHPSQRCHPESVRQPEETCSPEQSGTASEANRSAESKDPYLNTVAASPNSERGDGSTGYWILGTGYRPPRVLDIGSGAGFPALPLKIWAPQIHLMLIESNHKKSAFLREVSRALTLTDVNVITARTEALSNQPNAPRAEVVTLRAVEHFQAILPQAASFLAPNGILAILIGASQIPHLTTLPNLRWNPPINIPSSESRVLSLGVRL